MFVVWGKDDKGDIRGFVLEKGMKGLTANAIKGKLSLRASITGDIVLDNVRIPKRNMFPEVKGLKGPFSCLNNARYLIIYLDLGFPGECSELLSSASMLLGSILWTANNLGSLWLRIRSLSSNWLRCKPR